MDNSRRDYWCHQCGVEMTPLMAPNPTCPHCNGDFVELIEADNDPRQFVEDGGEHDHDHDHDIDGSESISYSSLEELMTTLVEAHRRATAASQQQQAALRSSQQQTPGQEGQQQAQPPPQHQQPAGALAAQFLSALIGGGAGGQGAEVTIAIEGRNDNAQDQDHQTQDNEDPPAQAGGQGGGNAPDMLTSLLQRLGFPLHLSMGGNIGSYDGGMFNMVGDPRDYVFGQNGLDNIISQLMEQHQGPVGASEEAIASIPAHKMTTEEVDAKIECSVCQDKFVLEDDCLMLPCHHIFHSDCLKPWLAQSDTCPTCRSAATTTTTTTDGETATTATAGDPASPAPAS